MASKSLRYIDLDNTPLADPVFAHIPDTVASVNLGGTKVTADAVAEFHVQHPEIDLVLDTSGMNSKEVER